jgi:hypothetical protein
MLVLQTLVLFSKHSMNNPVKAVQVITALGFAGYGISCFALERMRAEFARFRLPKLRRITGGLQIAASAGLLLGLRHPWMALCAASGLCVMMLCAMWVRIRIGDPLTGFLQAFVCFMLNLYILREHLLDVFQRL